MKKLIFLFLISLCLFACKSEEDEKLDIAWKHKWAGENRLSLSLHNEILEKNPTHIETLKSRGSLRRIMKDYSGAIEDFNSVIKIEPNKGEAYIMRGYVKLYFLHDLKGGLNDYEIGCEKEPTCDRFNQLGMVYRDLGAYAMAINNYDKAIEIAEKQPKTKNAWKNCKNMMAYYYENKGDAFIEMKKYNEAIKMFEISKNKALENNQTIKYEKMVGKINKLKNLK